MLCHLIFTRHEFERYQVDASNDSYLLLYDLVTALIKISESTRATFTFCVKLTLFFFNFWQVVVFRRLLPYWKEDNLFCACLMSNTFFIFFEIWARHRLLDVPRLPREKVSARLNFAAPVPIFVTFTRQKAEVPCLKFWARVPIFRGAVPKTLVV